MRSSTHRPPLLLVIAALAFVPACYGETAETGAAPDAAEQAAMQAQDEAALNALQEGFDPAVRARDIEAMMVRYAPNAIRMNPNVPAFTSTAAIRDAYLTAWDTNDYEIVNVVGETQISGDLAAVRGTYSGTITPKNGDPAFEDSGKWVAVLERQPDGAWKSLWEIWNSDLPPRPTQ